MQKKVLVATLSMALVLGVAGIVNAATMGSNAHNTLSNPSSATAYKTPNNVRSIGDLQGITPQINQTDPSTPNETNNQIQKTPGYNQKQTMPVSTPMSTNAANNQIQNLPGYTHMQGMSASTSMNGPMINSQSRQVNNETYRLSQMNASGANQQSYSNSNVRSMMGSMGR